MQSAASSVRSWLLLRVADTCEGGGGGGKKEIPKIGVKFPAS